MSSCNEGTGPESRRFAELVSYFREQVKEALLKHYGPLGWEVVTRPDGVYEFYEVPPDGVATRDSVSGNHGKKEFQSGTSAL